jgi:hypothetical protein
VAERLGRGYPLGYVADDDGDLPLAIDTVVREGYRHIADRVEKGRYPPIHERIGLEIRRGFGAPGFTHPHNVGEVPAPIDEIGCAGEWGFKGDRGEIDLRARTVRRGLLEEGARGGPIIDCAPEGPARLVINEPPCRSIGGHNDESAVAAILLGAGLWGLNRGESHTRSPFR